jgi:hypothetical protein
MIRGRSALADHAVDRQFESTKTPREKHHDPHRAHGFPQCAASVGKLAAVETGLQRCGVTEFVHVTGPEILRGLHRLACAIDGLLHPR